MDARTRAIVLAILIGSVLIAAAIYFPAAAGLQEDRRQPLPQLAPSGQLHRVLRHSTTEPLGQHH